MKKRYPLAWCVLSELLLFLFVAVGYLEKIHELYSVVIVLDAVTAVYAFFFILFWFYLEREYSRNPVSSSLSVLTLTILVTAVIGSSDNERLAVALFALIESWAVAIALIILSGRLKKVVGHLYLFILLFSIFYAVKSLLMGFESGETRYSGLSDQTNSLAVVCASSLIIALSLIEKRKNIIETVLSTLFLLLSSVLYAFTLTKTDSRTSFIALIVALSFFLAVTFIFRRDRLSLAFGSVLAVLFIAAALYLLLTSSRSRERFTLASLTSGRTTIWCETLKAMEAEDYFFGFGGNSALMTEKFMERGMEESLAVYLGQKHLMHNIYLQFLVEYGIVSALAFMSGSFILFASSFRIMGRSRKPLSILICSSTLLIFFFVHSLSESSIYFIGGAEQILFIMSAGIIYSYYRRRREST